jgi:hypothetical protein
MDSSVSTALVHVDRASPMTKKSRSPGLAAGPPVVPASPP